MKKYLSVLAAIAVVLSMAGCSASGGVNGPTPAPSGSSAASKSEVYGGTDIGGTGAKSDAAGGAAKSFAEMEMADTAPSAAAAGGEIDCETWKPGTEPDIVIEQPDIPPQAGLLTGGEWNDNAHWSDWQALYTTHNDWASYKKAWKNEADHRIAVKVTSNGEPLEGAKVSCGSAIASAVTDNKGMAYLFYPEIDGATQEITVDFCGVKKTLGGVNGSAELECDLGTVGKDEVAKSLDLMIMCDTTGSMGDELEYLKVELESIVRKIQSDNGNMTVRTSVNFYRDDGDEYVVRQFPFTDDIEKSAEAILEQTADGGGDFPEAVHTALDSAINNHSWNDNWNATRIMFLVLDAPPHEDAQIVSEVNKHIREAAEKGIRIVPIASSGIDKSTEYLLRTMSFTTGGTYTFLTDDSGVGESHLKPTIGAFNVEKLSDMMIRIVNSYL
ncbi:MAG TPA: hypothetical protein DER68_04185 [Ruminococcaceae bacterium]|nr:hypothetical protein [Oscillospiraceae bacterium]